MTLSNAVGLRLLSGAYYGNASGLSNVPASGVTGVGLDGLKHLYVVLVHVEFAAPVERGFHVGSFSSMFTISKLPLS
jgi:hypothetical protein